MSDGHSIDIFLPDETSTQRLGVAIGQCLRAGDFVGLVGDLGAGKTTLVKALLESIDPAMEASSPTYTLLNVYETVPPVYHFDLYRLTSPEDLEGVGYWDYVEAGDGICCVEWLDRVPEAWPGSGILVNLEHHARGRVATVKGDERLLKRLQALG